MSINCNPRTLILLGSILAVSSLCKCTFDNKDIKIASTISNKLQLKEVPLLGSSFSFSVPKSYHVEENNGEDFSVYYFSPMDSVLQPGYFGGLYFGNHPSFSDDQIDSCTISKLPGRILDADVKWNVRNCSGEYHIELITESKSGEGWNNYIHAFGRASSDQDLEKLIYVFSTLKKSR